LPKQKGINKKERKKEEEEQERITKEVTYLQIMLEVI
jgi:hypothetical protein